MESFCLRNSFSALINTSEVEIGWDKKHATQVHKTGHIFRINIILAQFSSIPLNNHLIAFHVYERKKEKEVLNPQGQYLQA